jgi:hypothetical protein
LDGFTNLFVRESQKVTAARKKVMPRRETPPLPDWQGRVTAVALIQQDYLLGVYPIYP